MEKDREELFSDFVRFSTAYVRSWDIDPTYPVLRYVQNVRRLTQEQKYWHTILYLTWYNMGSAEIAFTSYKTPCVPGRELFGLPTGTERRGMRGNYNYIEFLASVVEKVQKHGSLGAWIVNSTRAGGEKGWIEIRREVEGLRWGGTWASFKFADLLSNVHSIPITANDIGVGGKGKNAGPVPGMVQLTGLSWEEAATNVLAQKELLERSKAAGVPFIGLEQLETALCDFNSLTHGRYYHGHDIDSQQHHLQTAGVGKVYWDARLHSFPNTMLGELNGWEGVRPERKLVYANTGIILEA